MMSIYKMTRDGHVKHNAASAHIATRSKTLQSRLRTTASKPCCSDFGPERRTLYPRHCFCTPCDYWDANHLLNTRMRRESTRCWCTANHESRLFPTQLITNVVQQQQQSNDAATDRMEDDATQPTLLLVVPALNNDAIDNSGNTTTINNMASTLSPLPQVQAAFRQSLPADSVPFPTQCTNSVENLLPVDNDAQGNDAFIK